MKGAAIGGVKYRAKGLLAHAVPPARLLWCRRGRGQASVALTFDDGPDPVGTPRLLDLLDSHDVKATFFVLGPNVIEQKGLVRRMLDAGHEIGIHGFSHVSIRSMTDDELGADVARAERSVMDAGASVPSLYRPLFGEYRWRQLPVLWRLGKTVALWSVDSRDFEASLPEEVLARVPAEGLTGGDVVLFHDRFEVTARAIRDLVPRVRQRGLALTTVGALLCGAGQDSPP